MVSPVSRGEPPGALSAGGAGSSLRTRAFLRMSMLQARAMAVFGTAEARILLSNAFVIVSARTAGSLLTLIYTVGLARITSPHDMGIAMVAMAMAVLASVFVSLNVESGSIRFLVAYLASGEKAKAAGFVTFGWQVTAIASPMVVVLVLVYVFLLRPEVSGAEYWCILLTLAAAPVLALTRIYGRHATALDAVLRGVLPRLLVRPALFTVAIGVLFWLGLTVSASFVMLLFLVTAIAVFLLQLLLLRSRLGFAVNTRRDISDWRAWLGTGLKLSPMLVMGEFMRDVAIACAAIGMVAEDVASLGIALSIVTLLRFATTAVDIAFTPKIANGLVADDRARSQRLLLAAAALKCLTFLAGAVAIYLLRHPVLGLFGPHYVEAEQATLILLAVPLSAAILGPTALILNVLGNELEILAASLAGLIAIAVAAPLGGHFWGVEGAAAGVAAAVCLQQLALYAWCRRRTEVDPSVFAAMRLPRRRP